MRFYAGNPGAGRSNSDGKLVDPALYGYISRGEDSRLQHSETAQREYFDWILETFRQVENSGLAAVAECAEKMSADLGIKGSSASSEQVLPSLRKLREALLHSPPSEFSKKVHLFSVRVSSAVGHYQTYVPSIQYLLADGRSLLTRTERKEMASILVLHVTHRTGDTSEGFRLFFQYLNPHKECRILQAIVAWAQGDYHAWMELYNSESDHSVFAIMTMGLATMMRHMIECFNGAYYTYSLEDLERCLPKGVTWAEFRERYNVPWELEDNTVHIRRRQVRGKRVDNAEKGGGGLRGDARPLREAGPKGGPGAVSGADQ
ncbi:hypothetical protein METBIDRAFT_38975 [Metschnikowia bicuspidata var. bicuspidata NRRL YB-4993]|uniref:CSN8/PSMD8/EIF3K domain-containing protein n=1 Tax=Metschnikowia bicuspidata var. bicuspidata NRRL YB-4993 TaxID=869754 RepID=A0A1A0HD95_9ASCO|nr:hypothetical protein METBIDRAFT_38975 [Metschnikowia bicuspidata var. bicuspidata NRRL YB-4993]OBA21903.1 hypothetical protein METBIDRAFT_38975 [Metschnikowia bicuspidata var. bicuspidata NRRL YB-4993]